MGSLSTIFLNLIFSALGMGYFIYGKKQKQGMPLVAGILLMAFPYFISNIFAMLFLGIVLLSLPRFIKF